jgi:polyhydroxybutyrate depolymerase
MKKLILTVAFLGIAVASATATTVPLTLKWTVEGTERQALVFAPPPSGDAKMPLVFAFHGHGGSMEDAAHTMAIERAWPEALVVYMQGVRTFSRRVDPLALRTGWQLAPGDYEDRDLKFFDAVLSTLRTKYRVDDRRIYATGFSNGAYFSYLLWEERPSTFAAIASCAGSLSSKVHLKTPKPLLQITGAKDHVVPVDGQKRTIETVRALNGAQGEGEPCGPGCTLYSSKQNAPVETIFHPGGHVYPAWASEKIAEFLKNHRLAP